MTSAPYNVLPADGIVIGEHAVGGEALPVIQHVVIVPIDNQAGGHAHHGFARLQHGDALSFGEDAQVR